MAERRVRVRFAPSPTGPLHIGGVRTALYNYLFARQHGGDLVFRIEDTDRTRFVAEAEDYIIEAFKWLGIRFDEGVSFGGNYGPYRQSERGEIYKKYVKQLLDSGRAYVAFDTAEELNKKREEVENFQYDCKTRLQMRNSLTLPQEEVERLMKETDTWVVRFRVEPGQEILIDDMIRGEVRVKSEICDDKVLYKGHDQLPTYHLANIVDDHLMEITHVIRGEEWLPSAPLHVMLYEAFGWRDTMPRFAHLPLLLKPDGKGKLSKRDGDRLGFPVFPLDWNDPKSGERSSGYREAGYLPQAVVNFLALLGWNPGDDREIFSMDELIKEFSIDHCSRKGAKFDFEKGKWFNHEYLMNMDDKELAQLFKPVLAEHGVNVEDFSDDYIAQVVALVKSRANFVGDLWEQANFFFARPTGYSEKDIRKRWKPETPKLMRQLVALLETADFNNSQACETLVMDWIDKNELHKGNVMNAFRLTVVGECRGPHMFDITRLLGREETLTRINDGIQNIQMPADA